MGRDESLCLCDNMSVVAAVNKGSAWDPALMRLLRVLAFLTAILDITISAQHLPGAQNTSADALSRNNLKPFLSLNPQASPMPTIIPRELQELVFNQDLQWTSPSWMSLLCNTLITALGLPLAQHINLPNTVM